VTGAKNIPRGFRLRVPANVSGKRFLAAVPDAARSNQQKISTEVRVARGDTLFSIGRRNNIPWPAIAAANNLGPRSRLMVGQRLVLPRPGQAMPMLPAVAAQSAPAGTPVSGTPAPGGAAVTPAPAPAVAAGEASAGVTSRPAGDAPRAMPIPSAPAAPGTGLAVTAGLIQPAASAPTSSPLVTEDALALKDVDAARQEGVVRAAYGETVGHYADWAAVSAVEIRERNNMGSAGALHPGRRVVIPLHTVTAEAFNAQRLAYHRTREQTFFASYTVQDKIEVRLGRGQSVWGIAQEHNVPMWLLYRENPTLLERPVQAGMRVIVPQVHTLAAGTVR
jgi:membrane-bound lytic murein transglycosylase D